MTRQAGRLIPTVVVVSALVLALGSQPALALEPWALWDDFASPWINPDRWEGGADGTNAVREFTRQTLDARLQMGQRVYGAIGSDAGSQAGLVNLRFANPSAITAIDATLQIVGYELISCPTNPDVPFVMANIFGSFFNTGPLTPGSHVGDLVTNIQVNRYANSPDGEGVLRVGAGLGVCTSSNCSSTNWLTWIDLGTASKGTPVRLRVQWDPGNSQFIFQRDDEPQVFAPYTVPNTAPPGIQNKVLGAVTLAPNCSTGPRPAGLIRAFYDSVYVNASALPPSARSGRAR